MSRGSDRPGSSSAPDSATDASGAGPEPGQWDRIDAVLDALESVPADQRQAHLDALCPDPGVHRAVTRLLAAEPKSTGFLDSLFDELAPTRARSVDLTGRLVGAYRLLGLVGRGGMGSVYEAERADGAFEQRVALKLLAVALAGSEGHDRFLAERRILAGLEHPAIARIVDAGLTDDGTPWFAMEYVEGESITVYCDRRQLGIRDRLALFLQVCDAVEHAHHRLVVHRDLKPANVLVTADQRVKLLDFGIAKLIDPAGMPDPAPRTRTVMRLMTPEYASPEQVRGETVTTASDVYQLGLLLYELLTGHRAYAPRRRGAAELERVICEQIPARMSTVITRKQAAIPGGDAATQDAEALCRARRVSLHRLRRRLRGDLDNIALKALSKEPERRYASVDRLAQDIRRHLTGLPVTARADTWVYRGRKFLERHAIGASVSAVAVFLVLALVAGMTGFHTMRIQSERDQAEFERDRARVEAAKAQQMNQFLAGLFRSADPLHAGGADMTVRHALDRGVTQVERDLGGQPEVQADMLQVLGRTYGELGLYDTAENLLLHALDLRREKLGTAHPEVAATLAQLGMLRFRQGRFEAAREYMDEAHLILESALEPDAPELAALLRTLGPTYHRLGEHEQGLAMLERAVSIQARLSGNDSEAVAHTLNNLGVMLFEMGLLERSEAAQTRSLAIFERELGADHPMVGITLINLATVSALRGQLDEVEAMLRRSLVILRQTYGPEHGNVGMVLTNLGGVLTLSGRRDEAVETLEQALRIMRAAFGPDNPQVAMPMITLALAHHADGHHAQARRYFADAVEVREVAYGAGAFDPLLVRALIGLGQTEADAGNPAAAEQLLERALVSAGRADEWVDPLLEEPFHYLGGWLVERQRCAEAIPLLETVARFQRAQTQPLHPELAAHDLIALCGP